MGQREPGQRDRVVAGGNGSRRRQASQDVAGEETGGAALHRVGRSGGVGDIALPGTRGRVSRGWDVRPAATALLEEQYTAERGGQRAPRDHGGGTGLRLQQAHQPVVEERRCEYIVGQRGQRPLHPRPHPRPRRPIRLRPWPHLDASALGILLPLRHRPHHPPLHRLLPHLHASHKIQPPTRPRRPQPPKTQQTTSTSPPSPPAKSWAPPPSPTRPKTPSSSSKK